MVSCYKLKKSSNARIMELKLLNGKYKLVVDINSQDRLDFIFKVCLAKRHTLV